MKRTGHRLQLIILAVIFLLSSVIISESGLFSRLRVDLTDNNMFTLSQGTKNIVNNIDEQVHLRLFFSEQAARDLPMLRTYFQRVKDFLEELTRFGAGKLKLSIIDPVSFSEEEDQASQFGLQALPVGEGGENVFFGIAATNALDNVAIIPFFQPERESYLEYDLAELIYNLNNPQKPLIGVMSAEPMLANGPTAPGMPAQEQIVLTQLKEMYTVQSVALDQTDLSNIDLLILVHPQDLPEQTLFAIDQYVMAGGRLLVFVDPMNQTQEVPADPQNPMAQFQANRSSDLAPLFKAWGVEYDPGRVVLDNPSALSIQSTQGQTIRHLGINAWDGDNLSDDIVNFELNKIHTALAGYFEAEAGRLTPLITSHQDSMTTDVDPFSMLFNPASLFQQYQADEARYVIAARLNGPLESAFKEGFEDMAADDVITEQSDPRVVLVADADMLYDRLWVQSQNFFGRQVFSPFADNGYFVNNLVDNLSGSEDLIKVRSRGSSHRPFDKVQAIQRASDKKYRETENQLRQQLRETEAKLNELQQAKGSESQLILSSEQQQEIERFKQRKLEVRKQLREVKRNLNKDIEALGNRIKFMNIALIPILITLVIIIVSAFRSRRREYKK
ncbi:MAG: Gldg family protein [Marinicella pacifica]